MTVKDASASLATCVSLAELRHAEGAVLDLGALTVLSIFGHRPAAGDCLALFAEGSIHDPPHVVIGPPVAHRTLAVTTAASELNGLLQDSLVVLNKPVANIVREALKVVANNFVADGKLDQSQAERTVPERGRYRSDGRHG